MPSSIGHEHPPQPPVEPRLARVGAPSYGGYCSVTNPEGAPTSMDIAGVTALVTGGASGLGLATATRLVSGGASVVVVDLPRAAGTEVAEQLGNRARFAAADVT